MDYSSDEDNPYDGHFTHLQLCATDDDLYGTHMRSAEQALLTIHGTSFLDSDAEDNAAAGEGLGWSAADMITRGCASPTESVSLEELDDVDDDEDDDEGVEEEEEEDLEDLEDLEGLEDDDLDRVAHLSDLSDLDEQSFHLSALPSHFRVHAQQYRDDHHPATSAGLYGPVQELFDEEDLPNVVPASSRPRVVVRHQSVAGSALRAHLERHRDAEVSVSSMLPPHHGGRDGAEGEESEPTAEVREPKAAGTGFLNPFELACEVVRAAREESEGGCGSRPGSAAARQGRSLPPMGPYAPAVAPSPGGRRQKPRERVRFVWQPYESFSQYNFHTMYSMKRKKKSRAENPLPAVGSALTGLVHLRNSGDDLDGRLPPCYFASPVPPVEHIRWRGGDQGVEDQPGGRAPPGAVGHDRGRPLAASLGGDKGGKVASELQKKAKLTLRRQSAKSPIHASLLVAKHSSRTIVSGAKAATLAPGGAGGGQRRPARVPQPAGVQSLSKIDLRKASDQPSTSSAAGTRHDPAPSANAYLNNSSLLPASEAQALGGGRKGVVRGLTFGRRASEHSVSVRGGVVAGRELRIQGSRDQRRRG